MSQLSPQQHAQLTGSGECFIHTHPRDRMSFADRLELMDVTPVTLVTSNHVADKSNELLLCDTSTASITVTLPVALQGREFNIVKRSPANALYIAPSGTDEILGSTTGVVVYNDNTSLHFKAIFGGYILL